MDKQVEFEIRANMDKWRKEMADLIEIAFLRSDNIDQFVRYADEALKEKFGMPYSFSLETIYYSLRTIWELKSDNARDSGVAEITSGLTPRALDVCPECFGDGSRPSSIGRVFCDACNGTGKRQ